MPSVVTKSRRQHGSGLVRRAGVNSALVVISLRASPTAVSSSGVKILVTGASGFVGGKVMERARQSGRFQVRGIGRRSLPGAADYSSIDLSEAFDFAFSPDVVIHAAARSSPWGTRREFWRNNVTATRNVVEFCRRHGHPRLVYISSGSVFYRNEHQVGLTEKSPIGPQFVNTYAESKAAGENIVRGYEGPWVILRPRAVFGEGDTVLFPRILAAAQRGQLPLFVNDGPPIIGDLIGITTLCDYILRAAERLSIAGDFNLTNAHPVQIMEFLFGIFDRLGLPKPTRRMPVRRAMALARLTEIGYRLLPFLGEPPITRFGVSVFAWTKTFHVEKSLSALGAPSASLHEEVEKFIAWQSTLKRR